MSTLELLPTFSYQTVGALLSRSRGRSGLPFGVAADGGRGQLLTNALSLNLGTAVLKTLLISFDLRPPTAELWLPSSRQVVFKPSLIAVSVCLLVLFPAYPVLKTVVPPQP